MVKVQVWTAVRFSEEISEVYPLYRYGKRKSKYSDNASQTFLISIIHADFKMDALDLAIQVRN